MAAYSLILELFLYGSVVYFLFKKRDLVIIYMPMFFFVRNLIGEPVIRAIIWYAIVVVLIAYSAHRLNLIKKVNVAAVALLFYLSLLFLVSHDISDTRSSYLAIFSFISVFIVAPNLYTIHKKEEILHELWIMSYIVIILFVTNCVLSSLTGYAPRVFYGNTTGILYGNMAPTSFMLVPVALFIFLSSNLKKMSLVNVVLGFMAFGFLLVSLRRTAALAGIVAVLAFMALLFLEKDKRRFIRISGMVVLVAVVGVLFTDLKDQFSDRYQSRFEGEAVVQGDEGRFTDHVMVYEDLFVDGRYSAIFGYGFFNSPGNYGGGVHGDRPLHPDLPVIVHASGMLGLVLYLAMVGGGFASSWSRARTPYEKILWLFCLAVFSIFTLSGRITETAYAMGLFLLLFLPVADVQSPRTKIPGEKRNLKPSTA